MTEYNFHISDAAANQIKKIQDKRGNLNLFLRISITGGGCAGFSYNFEYDEVIKSDDIVFYHQDTKLVIDQVSMQFLDNASLDYISILSGSSFEITHNPNAVSKCGCKKSFSVEL